MHIVITGGAGFIGSRLARHLLERPTLTSARGEAQAITSLTLLDQVAPSNPPVDPRVRVLVGDITDPRIIDDALPAATDSVFHLAAVVSAAAEADFDLGMRVNVDATRILLERCRKLRAPPKVVFTSSLAVFGGDVPDPVTDDTPIKPQTSYGTQKAIGEFLVYDMTRKGFIDGRSMRLPTITVRPGKPNRAASSFASGIIREPVSGVDGICPVSPGTRMWVQSPRTVVHNLIAGHEAKPSQFRDTRSINVPGLCVGVGEMVEALRSVAGEDVAARVKWSLDPAIDRIVQTWPARFAPALGPSLGMRADRDFESIVRAYIEDDAPRM
ncbi:MAG TPA: D-erythronate dehydrogenase [Casimicrobiaceae bacterium]|jgi:nucleoside-diphosphate-sugar epimerase